MDLLDTEQLASLYDLAGPQTGEMVEDFVQTAGGTLRELEDFLHAGASAEAADLAHQLKGGAVTLGFSAFSQRAGACEAALRAGERPDAAEAAALGTLLTDSAAEVRRILSGKAG